MKTTDCSMSRKEVIDAYFLEHRAKLIDVAAFLDRVDRAAVDKNKADDFRMTAFRRAIAILTDGGDQRAKRILEQLSDHSATLPESAGDLKSACGAPPPEN